MGREDLLFLEEAGLAVEPRKPMDEERLGESGPDAEEEAAGSEVGVSEPARPSGKPCAWHRVSGAVQQLHRRAALQAAAQRALLQRQRDEDERGAQLQRSLVSAGLQPEHPQRLQHHRLRGKHQVLPRELRPRPARHRQELRHLRKRRGQARRHVPSLPRSVSQRHHDQLLHQDRLQVHPPPQQGPGLPFLQHLLLLQAPIRSQHRLCTTGPLAVA